MARGINKVILIGNLGNDPEINQTNGGVLVANISIATDESYKDKTTGQMVPKTEWHRVVMFEKLAEVVQNYLKKGSKVYIEGKLETRKWQDQSGTDRYTTEIKAHQLQMLDGKPDNGTQPQQQVPQQPQQMQQPQQPQQNYQHQAPQQPYQGGHQQPNPRG